MFWSTIPLSAREVQDSVTGPHFRGRSGPGGESCDLGKVGTRLLLSAFGLLAAFHDDDLQQMFNADIPESLPPAAYLGRKDSCF